MRFCFRRVGFALLKRADELCYPAFQRGSLVNGGEITNDLAAQGGGHLAEGRLGLRGIAKSEDKGRREKRLARIQVTLNRDLHDSTRIDAQLLSNVAMDRQAIAALSSRHQRGLHWNSFHFTAHCHVRSASAESARDVGGYIDKTNDSYFVDFGGENLQVMHFADMIPHSVGLRPDR